MTRAIATIATIAFALLWAVSGIAMAQSTPLQTVRLIVPFTPGGGTDAVARLIADKLGQLDKRWSFIVDNKPGAS